jgi:hypothetical protein
VDAVAVADVTTAEAVAATTATKKGADAGTKELTIENWQLTII